MRTLILALAFVLAAASAGCDRFQGPQGESGERGERGDQGPIGLPAGNLWYSGILNEYGAARIELPARVGTTIDVPPSLCLYLRNKTLGEYWDVVSTTSTDTEGGTKMTIHEQGPSLGFVISIQSPAQAYRPYRLHVSY